MNKLVIKYNGIEHEIQVRESDGYLNATQMCKAGDKLFNDYIRLKSTNEYHNYLFLTTNIPVVKLVDIKEGRYGGSWVHKKVAYHIAAWISPVFMDQLIDTYDRLMSGDLTLVKEVVQNHDKINNTQSSVLIQTQELELVERRERLNELQIKNKEREVALKERYLALEKQKMLDKVEVEQALDTLDSSGAKAYSYSIALLKDINGTLTDTDKRYFNDLIKNNVARRSTLLALESREAYEERKQRFVIPVSDIYKDLTGKPGNRQIWIQLGKEIALAYRAKHNKEPQKLESFVDGKTRLINAYNTRDDPWVLDYADQIIKANLEFYNM